MYSHHYILNTTAPGLPPEYISRTTSFSIDAEIKTTSNIDYALKLHDISEAITIASMLQDDYEYLSIVFCRQFYLQ